MIMNSNLCHFSPPPQKHVIIRDRNGKLEELEDELQEALESKAKYIIIEPFKLGELTARWIRVGNFFHKVSVVFGVTSLVLIYAREDRGYIYIPFGLISVINAGLYATSYRDPCCKYQLETSTKSLEKLPLHDLSSSCPIVLVRRDDTRRKWLQNIVAISAGGLCAWKLYHWFYDI